MRVFHNNVIVPESQQLQKQNNSGQTASKENSQVNFNNILSNKISEQKPLFFSKHASMRLSARDITLSPDQLRRVESGVDKALEKGINDSLVLVDNVALVVNVKSKTVITAMNKENDNIFTNIDGAVIV